jgi:hypothetical protein
MSERLCKTCNKPHRNYTTLLCNVCRYAKKYGKHPCETCKKPVNLIYKHCFECNLKQNREGKITCECGSVYGYYNQSDHLRTTKHQEYLNLLKEN